jgi:hypothetical protein
MVVVMEHHEGAPIADEEGRCAMAEALAGLWQREADFPDLAQPRSRHLWKYGKRNRVVGHADASDGRHSLDIVISRAAVEAVTTPQNVAAGGDGSGVRALRSNDVVAELKRLEGLSAEDAARLAREAVIHVGGHVERLGRSSGSRVGRLVRRGSREVWWVPEAAIGRPAASGDS